MKKKITIIFVLVMVFVMLVTFIGCDKNENKDNDQTGEETPTPEEPVSTAVSNSQLIEDTLDEILGEKAIHLSLDNWNMELNFDGSITYEGPIDLYLRKSDTGYDMALFLQVLNKEKCNDENLNKEYVDATAVYANVIYVGGYIYLHSRMVNQVIVDGAGYESIYEYEKAPEVKDSYLLETAVTDWEKAAELKDSLGESRLSEETDCRKANTLQGLIEYIVYKADFLKDWGWTSVDKVAEVVKNLLGEAANLVKGETEADENGNRVLELNIDALEKYNEITGIVNANLEKPLGEFVKALTEKDDVFVKDIINRLFPAEGDCLTINNFVKELERILGENQIIFSLKSLMNRIQTASGLTTQQIADALNPLLKSVLPEGTSVSINPKDGETLYDTLERSAFDMLGVDTILSIISPETTDETSGETVPALTSARLNAKLTAALYGETDSLTFTDLAMTYEAFEIVLAMANYSADNMKADLKFNLDKDNKLTSIEADADIEMTMILPDGFELPEGEEIPKIAIKVNGVIQVTYENNDDKFSVSDWNVQNVTYTLPAELAIDTYYYADEILQGAGVAIDEGADIRITSESVIVVREGGLISGTRTYVGSFNDKPYVTFYELPADYLEMYMTIYCNGTCYIVKLLPPATQG